MLLTALHVAALCLYISTKPEEGKAKRRIVSGQNKKLQHIREQERRGCGECIDLAGVVPLSREMCLLAHDSLR